MNNYFNGSGTIGFTCDNCGREMQGCTWVNGMKFCAKCYQETFGNTNLFEKELRDKIADLEAKLAESESKIKVGEFWHSAYQGKQLDYDKVYAELRQSYNEKEQLKQKLAEKEKEILEYVEIVDGLHKQLSDKCGFCEEGYKKQLADKDKEVEKLKTTNDRLYKKNKKLENQIVESNIKFYKKGSIEQLEKVKEDFFDIANGWWLCFKDGTQYMTHDELEGCMREIFDNQIKQLKGEK